MRTCRKCGIEKDLDEFGKTKKTNDGRVARCKKCLKEYFEAYRAINRDELRRKGRARPYKPRVDNRKILRAINPKQFRAQDRVGDALRYGKIERAPCMICGEKQSVAHHDNYDRPLDVTWLCYVHHNERHKTLPVWRKTM